MRLVAGLLLALLPAQAAMADAQAMAPRPALWKLADADTTIYLFGTVHMLPADHEDWLTGPVAQALNGADEIVTEVVDPTGAATQDALLRHGMLPKGQTLHGQLSKRQRALLDQLLARIALPSSAVESFKPWYAAVLLSSLPLVRRGFSAHDGVEAALNERTPDKPHRGLETAEQQLALLDGLPRKSQIAYLTTVIAEYDRIGPMVDAMAAAWSRGDADTLGKLIQEDEGKDDPLLTERLILSRNRNWADWIERRMAAPGTVFIAVGAGHLAGHGSVQDLLAGKAISVERVQ